MPVTFSANGTNAAKNTVVTFTKAGVYNLLVTIILTTKSSILLPAALGASSYLATSIAAGNPPKFSLKRAAWLAGLVGVVVVGFVLIQWNRIRYFLRLGIDLHGNACGVQHSKQLMVESSNRFWREWEGAVVSVGSAKLQAMIREVELDFEGTIVVRNGRSGKAAGIDVERAVPPVVLQWSEAEANLADDLRPHVKRAVGILPLLQRQFGPIWLGRHNELIMHPPAQLVSEPYWLRAITEKSL